jgi:hypothetical protein
MTSYMTLGSMRANGVRTFAGLLTSGAWRGRLSVRRYEWRRMAIRELTGSRYFFRVPMNSIANEAAVVASAKYQRR